MLFPLVGSEISIIRLTHSADNLPNDYVETLNKRSTKAIKKCWGNIFLHSYTLNTIVSLKYRAESSSLAF